MCVHVHKETSGEVVRAVNACRLAEQHSGSLHTGCRIVRPHAHPLPRSSRCAVVDVAAAITDSAKLLGAESLCRACAPKADAVAISTRCGGPPGTWVGLGWAAGGGCNKGHIVGRTGPGPACICTRRQEAFHAMQSRQAQGLAMISQCTQLARQCCRKHSSSTASLNVPVLCCLDLPAKHTEQSTNTPQTAV